MYDPARTNWRLRDGQALRMLAGNDESVIYNDYSGETHLLDALAVSLLQHLQSGADNSAGICAVLACEWEFDADTGPHDVLSLANQLKQLGLIEPCLP